MGLFDKLKGIVNPDSMDGDYATGEDEYYEKDSNYSEGGNFDQQQYSQYAQQQYPQYGQQQYQQQNAQNNTGVSINASALELKVVRPEKFENVTQIADHLIKKRTVVLNLEVTNRETSRRIIDFLTGVAYSINGNLKKVANNTYVITPCNVDVSSDAAASAPAAAAAAATTQQQYDNVNGDMYNGL